MPLRALPKKTRPDRRASAAKRGYDRRWRNRRLAYLRKHPLCKACQAADVLTPATVVDHVVRHRGQRDPLFWDESNWQPLCKRHHDQKTARETHGRSRAA